LLIYAHSIAESVWIVTAQIEGIYTKNKKAAPSAGTIKKEGVTEIT